MHITSLGSSFAAGPGLEPSSNSKAKRSAVNYPSLLAKSLGATHTDLTVSGATLLNVASVPQKVLFDVFEPQVNGIPTTTDVVTITGGGNDLQYIGKMMTANASGLASAIFKIGAWAIGHDLKATPPDEAEIVRRLHTVYDGVHARAPSAHILLVGYPVLLGLAADSNTTPYSAEQIESFRAIASLLERASAKSVEGRPLVHHISLAHLSETHGIESAVPWVSGPKFSFFGGAAPLHPTRDGMVEIARIVEQKMRDLGLV
jgi:lysophospholipase L1-like esterase